MILLDSYGWIEYFTEGPLAGKYARYIEEVSEENTVIPIIVVYEVYRLSHIYPTTNRNYTKVQRSKKTLSF